MFWDTPQSVIYKLDTLIQAERKNHERLQPYDIAMESVLSSDRGRKLILRYDRALQRAAADQAHLRAYEQLKNQQRLGETVAEREKRERRQKTKKAMKGVFDTQTLYLFKVGGGASRWANNRHLKKLQPLIREVEARIPRD